MAPTVRYLLVTKTSPHPMRTLIASTINPPTASIAQPAPSERLRSEVWELLAEHVRDWGPDFVVLVARRMPRLAQVLSLDFGAALLTDLAIPFSSELLRGARVAIVDDVVTVGTTMDAVRRSVLKAGASEAEMFAIGVRSHDVLRIPADQLHLIDQDPLGDDRAVQIAGAVPLLLQELDRPYDLDFPIIECAALPPFSNLGDVVRGLSDCFGAAETRDVTSWAGRRCGVFRVSVEIPGVAEGWLTKLRIYGAPDAARFWVVPMAVPPAIASEDLPVKDELWDTLTESVSDCDRFGEPGVRAAMFSYSLAFGLEVLRRCASVMQPVDPVATFSRSEAALAFGGRAIGLLVPDAHATAMHPTSAPRPLYRTSPFLDAAKHAAFPAQIAQRAASPEPARLFEELFMVLSSAVGALNPENFELSTLATREQVSEDPYIRLRIGPTWPDLVAIIREAAHLLGGDAAVSRCSLLELSTLLDQYVDCGSVVPTFAKYGRVYYRVYRKGEADPHEETVERVCYAWTAYDRPLSMTRFSKILTVVALAPASSVPFSVAAVERGNVACFNKTVLDDAAEIGNYLRSIRRAVRVPDQEARVPRT
ncbi:MAG: hypothetical protein JWM34_3634 [Ilumatobacteraceae bacterium]|nr:hypothetical protein [Ilumatobacteraceae bacterium]